MGRKGLVCVAVAVFIGLAHSSSGERGDAAAFSWSGKTGGAARAPRP
ncbi:hypothetical protein ACFQ2B_13835 [Streptomyces stramineus]